LERKRLLNLAGRLVYFAAVFVYVYIVYTIYWREVQRFFGLI
jgi:hypothetical protein